MGFQVLAAGIEGVGGENDSFEQELAGLLCVLSTAASRHLPTSHFSGPALASCIAIHM